MVKVGANEPCTCGSGLKYKRCCAVKSKLIEKSSAPWILGAVALAGASAFAVWANFRSPDAAPAPVAAVAASQTQQAAVAPGAAPAAGGETEAAPAAVAVDGAPVASGPPFPQPDGAVPPGKVWSAEHGHWHDLGPAAAARPGAPVANVTFPSQNKRPISTPDGRVWSEEHQHWHDAKANGGISDVRVFTPPPKAGSQPGTPAPGPAPEGKVWSSEHGHWHDLKGAATEAPKPAAPEATPPVQP